MLDKIRGKINHKKFVFADKVISFCLNKDIDNQYIILILFRIYELLTRNTYVLEHRPSNHHYIPQFILRNFKAEKGLIFQYEYFKTPKKVSIEKEAAMEFNLYVTTDRATKKNSDFVEKQIFALSMEKYASRIINEFLSGNEFALTSLKESIISTYIAFQYTRTPKFLYFIKEVLEYLSLEKKVPIEDMTKLDFYEKAFFKNIYGITPSALGAFGLKNKLVMDGAKNLIMVVSMGIANHLSILIHKKNLRMLESTDPAFFYLSDSPADIFNYRIGRSVGPFLWEFDKDCIIFMPVSPKHCLYYSSTSSMPAGVAGGIIEKAIPRSIFQFAYSDRKAESIESVFKNLESKIKK